MRERPEDLVKKWEKRLARSPIKSRTADLMEEVLEDLRGLVERNKGGFWDLPPLPDYPGARIVIDCPEGRLAHETIIQAGIEGEHVTLEGKFVQALFKVDPDPIPERVEKALRAAVVTGNGVTNERWIRHNVERIWRESK